MFSNQQELSIPDLKQRAVDLKLDSKRSISVSIRDGTRPQFKATFRKARAGATALRHCSSAAVLSGNQPYSEIKDVIEDELQRKQASK
jgi:hypothetical protein